MLFTKVAILAAAGLVAAEQAAPQVTARAVLPRDLPDDIKSWAESKAGGKVTDIEEWAKSNGNEIKDWASEHGGDAKSWVQSNYNSAGDYIGTKLDAASTRIEGAISGASASASAAADDNDNAASALSGQSGAVAMLAAIGATAFGFFLI
ncbi:uncharacterized protein B0J16DRAFT_343933 [Fusarium flagelliforme]|jgi:hypothetical protein|uniref:Uncharacterized protein n=2 Tax=Fusarium incarnatum-equiseti species complex TaxID=450425 RepID=A0A395MCW2_9HYPO|nr:uncharacterized protein B0J16DRAFT_343933 [Fusarium flagelliforme]KAH7182598.1 hypothetical protein B0J16DRAFT_343933 [Fusarium flagelliforme]RFN45762.1 hypothetical protein FIE12Z_9967 [Fusarium flagelliforme]CAG7562822.1 unnamed protein product [Fusarium equiseti]